MRLDPEFASRYGDLGFHRVVAESYANLGIRRGVLGDELAALEAFNQALQFDPSSAFAYRNRGVARGRLGDNRGALEDFQRAAALYAAAGDVANYREIQEIIEKWQHP